MASVCEEDLSDEFDVFGIELYNTDCIDKCKMIYYFYPIFYVFYNYILYGDAKLRKQL